MYVQYVKLTAPKARYPLLMWHGGGLTGVTFETKPDDSPAGKASFSKQVTTPLCLTRSNAARELARFPEI